MSVHMVSQWFSPSGTKLEMLLAGAALFCIIHAEGQLKSGALRKNIIFSILLPHFLVQCVACEHGRAVFLMRPKQ